MLTPILQAFAGLVVLVLAVTIDQPVSLGSLLGVMLLLSATVRYLIARERTNA